MNTGTGLAKILLGIATLGFVPALYPTFVSWTPPPVSEQMRGSKQRRVMPKGYPWSGLTNEKSAKRLVFFFWWYERLYLFWTTPVVLFYADKVVGLCVTVMFTVWFVAHRQAISSGQHSFIAIMPFKLSSNLEVEPLQSVELALCLYFASSLLREFLEILIAVVRHWDEKKKFPVIKRYFSKFWNVLDLSEIVAFFVGIGYRLSCKAHGCMSTRRAGADAEEYKDEVWNVWSMAYAICLCIAWFRTLRSCDSPVTNFRNVHKKCFWFFYVFLYPSKHAIPQVLIPRLICFLPPSMTAWEWFRFFVLLDILYT